MSLKISNKFLKIFNKLNRNYNKLLQKKLSNFWVFLNKFLNNCKKLKTNFAKTIMRIVYEKVFES